MRLLYKIYLYTLLILIPFFIFTSRYIIHELKEYKITTGFIKSNNKIRLNEKRSLFQKIKYSLENKLPVLPPDFNKIDSLYAPSWQFNYCLLDSNGVELEAYTQTRKYSKNSNNYSPSKRIILDKLENIAFKASSFDYNIHFGVFYIYSHNYNNLQMNLISTNLHEKNPLTADKIKKILSSDVSKKIFNIIKIKHISLYNLQDGPQSDWMNTDSLSIIEMKSGDSVYSVYDWITQNIFFYTRLKDNRILLIYMPLEILTISEYLTISKMDSLSVNKPYYILNKFGFHFNEFVFARDIVSGMPVLFHYSQIKILVFYIICFFVTLLILSLIFIAFNKIRNEATQISLISTEFVENSFMKNIQATILDYLNEIFNHFIDISKHLLNSYQLKEIDEGLEKSFVTIKNALNELMENKQKEAVYTTQLELKKEELERAREIQLSMLPKNNIFLDKFDIVGRMRTATEVGGDYYDFFKVDENRFCIAWGDATGHGVGAGLVVGMVKAALRSLILHSKKEIKVVNILKNINSLLKESISQRSMGIGLGVAILNIKSGQLDLCSTGLPLPYYYKMDKEKIESINLKGFPLGFFKKISIKSHSLFLEKGSLLIVTTDGFAERMNPKNEMWDYERFESSLRKHCRNSRDVNQIMDNIFDDCDQFANGRETIDDMTIAMIHWK